MAEELDDELESDWEEELSSESLIVEEWGMHNNTIREQSTFKERAGATNCTMLQRGGLYNLP